MEGTQRVFVKYKNEPLLDLMVKEDEKVGEFKEHLDRILVGNAEADRSTSVFRLMHNGKELQDNSTIIGNGVQNCDW